MQTPKLYQQKFCLPIERSTPGKEPASIFPFLYNMITFTFKSICHIWAHLSSVILQPYKSHQLHLTIGLEVKWQKFLKNLYTVQSSPTVATSANTLAKQLLISRCTCGNILEKSLSIAINANTLALKLVPSRNTC